MKRLLLVENNQHVLRLLLVILNRFSLDITTVSSGEDALQILDDSFDFVLTDMHMGKVDGNDVARKAKSINKDIVTILFYSPLKIKPEHELFDLIFLKNEDIGKIITRLSYIV